MPGVCAWEASDISSSALKRRGNAGLRQLSSRGGAAASSLRQFGRGAGFAALAGMAVGAASDASKLYRRQIGAQEFASRRGADAVEQSTSYAAGVIATTGVMAGLNSIATGGGVMAGTAASVAGSTLLLPLAVTAAAGGAVVYSLRPARHRAEAWAARRSRRGTARTLPIDSLAAEGESPSESDPEAE